MDLQTSNTSKNLLNFCITSIKPEDRNSDGSLLPEARERALLEVESYIKSSGHVNISYLSRRLGVARQHAKTLVLEIMGSWKEEGIDPLMVRIKWYEELLQELDNYPERFTPEYVRMLGLKSGIMDKIDALWRLEYPNSGPRLVQNNFINMHLWENVKPKTLEAMKQDEEVLTPD